MISSKGGKEVAREMDKKSLQSLNVPRIFFIEFPLSGGFLEAPIEHHLFLTPLIFTSPFLVEPIKEQSQLTIIEMNVL